jgi:hypothetical protein
VLRHQLGQDFILLPDLLFQFLNALLALAALRSTVTLQCHGGISEQLLLPAVKTTGAKRASSQIVEIGTFSIRCRRSTA